jgi:hypothetical protein
MAKKQASAHPPFNQVIGGSVFQCVWDPSNNQYSCSEAGAAMSRSAKRALPAVGAPPNAKARAMAPVVYQHFVFRCVRDEAANTYSCRAVSAADVPKGTRIFSTRAKAGAKAKSRATPKSPRKRGSK